MKTGLGCLSVLVLVIAALVVAAKSNIATARESKRAQRAAFTVYFEGHRLFDEKRYAEAAEKYAAWVRWAEAAGEDVSETLGLIGRSLDLAGRPEEAERYLRTSVAAQARPHVCVYMAHFLARNRSVADALAWVDALHVDPTDRKEILGAFYAERSEFEQALPHLKRQFELTCGGTVEFDAEHRLKVGPGEVDTNLHNRIAAVLYPLEDLSAVSLAVGDVDAALRYSAMGISVGQFLTRDATYTNEKYRACGSPRCRMVRARIAISKKDWTTAAEEVAFAQAVADWAYMGYEEELAAVTKIIEDRGRAK